MTLRRAIASDWTRSVQLFHAFVARLSPSAFVAIVETSLVSLSLGLYLSFQEVTEGFRWFLLPSALVAVAFSLFLLFFRSRRREKLEGTHTTPFLWTARGAPGRGGPAREHEHHRLS